MPAQCPDPVTVLQAALDAITRALATATDETIPGLVAERAELRAEKAALHRRANVIPLRGGT